ncbi:sensor histidine kinase [Glaciecola sp. KUL10]|uniref:sensor histidine kinase n=1 Tax=Glaciecola sp. (strain KUL10) TaxID=2161813 RepID=UPI000D786052|nr:histidine kinase [Glaciecola sp. KUL10]GBL05027.1 sensor histidine kinase [Glaciecola sp. KUL10]
MFNAYDDVQLKLPKLASDNKKKWSYGSLVFSLFYFVPLFFTPDITKEQTVYMLLCYVAFLATHIFALNSGLKAFPILLLTAVVISSSFVSIGGYALYGYPLFILGYQYRLKQSVFFAAGIVVVAFLIHQLWWQYVWFVFIQFLFISLGLYAFGLMERKETLHQLAQIQSADEIKHLSSIAERERIGRDLHDIAGHALSSISLKAQVAAKMIEKQRYATAKDEVLALAELSQSLLSEIRKTVSNIKQLSLSDELEKLFEQLRANDIIVNKKINHQVLGKLSALQETQLSLIFKEAITNVLRHSNSSVVNISIELDDVTQMLLLVIENDGITHAKYQSSNGLNGIQERVANLGGELNIVVDSLFSLFIALPLNRDTL